MKIKNDDLPICTDCKWSSRFLAQYRLKCHHPKATSKDIVDGTFSYESCRFMREFNRPCSNHGKFFEPKASPTDLLKCLLNFLRQVARKIVEINDS